MPPTRVADFDEEKDDSELWHHERQYVGRGSDHGKEDGTLNILCQ
jgi:hypothetical protein